ncbi:MAG: peptidoglycan -binding protein [Pseudomonadota bacterium]|nr:peptidoglycan -binding protein [Pseudomonadota bacterium]
MLLVNRQRRTVDIWPGFVDALAAMLMVVMFVLLLFSVGQFLLNDALVGRDLTLDQLRGRITGLANVLAMERKEKSDLQERLSARTGELEVTLKGRDEFEKRLADMTLQAQGSATELQRVEGELQLARNSIADKEQTLQQQRDMITERDQTLQQQHDTITERDQILQQQRDTITAREQTLQQQRDTITGLETDRGRLQTSLEVSQQETAQQTALVGQAQASVSELNNQIATLNEQLARINQVLESSEARLKDKDVEIEDLGQRLNLAMADKVEELSRYRSDFFGKLREALSDNPDVRIEGDRFVLPSEVLFSSASADLDKQGAKEISTVARTLKEITQQIPDDIDWVLRVDGHTDRRSIRRVFASNWELSSARAISIVKYMISQGIPAEHLVAAGFGQYHPIDPGNSEEAYRRNRRIELKLTSR